jgi:hypothetical protein
MKLTRFIRNRGGMILAAAALAITSLLILNFVRSKMIDPLAEQSEQQVQSLRAN